MLKKFIVFTLSISAIVIIATSFSPITKQWFPSFTTNVGNVVYQFQVSVQKAKDYTRIVSLPKATNLAVPVLNVSPATLVDTWGAARSENRVHEGIDIFADRGTYVVSPTEAIVSRIGYGRRGGNYVFTTGPGGERYYYAHLDSVDEYIDEGMLLGPNQIIGTVGNTGNASGTPPHLHFGIYGFGGAINPFPRLITNTLN